MSDHYHYDYASTNHDHRGQYADDRHDHDLDYAEKHHRHYDLETDDKTAQQGITCLRAEVDELRRQLDDALERIRQLEAEAEADVQRENWELREAAEADAWGGRGLSTSYEEWLAEGRNERETGHGDVRCVETSDGEHCGDWHEGGRCGACGLYGPDPDEDQADGPELYDPGPAVDDEGGMSEYRYLLPEDYERGQS